MSVRFAVLGDSIADGQGAARPEEAVGPRLRAQLLAEGIDNELRVFAQRGARSDALVGQARRAVQWGAQLAVVIIGANDVARLVPAQTAAAQLADAVRQLRDAGAAVVVAPAPDLSAVPWVPERLRPVVAASSRRIRDAQARAALAAGARVADVDGASAGAFAADVRLFSSDRFHPSSAGHAVIADMLMPALLAAAADVVDAAEGA